MVRIIGSVIALVISLAAEGADVRGISNTEAVSGLKQALADGSTAAVAQLGVENGFFKNPKVRISLLPALKRIESAMRFAGMRKQADLVLAMNRAAEAAVPEAKALRVESIRSMSIQDAKGILTGATPRQRSTSAEPRTRASAGGSCRS